MRTASRDAADSRQIFLEDGLLFDDRFSLDSPTGALLNVYGCRARGRPRGVLLVHHGLAEHAGRYARFAAEMAGHGFFVYAHDHRGHGSTSALDAPLRRFANKNGGPKLVADCRAVHEHAAIHHPGLPVVVFGHSMGALIAINYAVRNGRDLAGLAFWNSKLSIGFQDRLAILAIKVEKALKGSDVASSVFGRGTIETWAKSVEPREGMADWLTHDPEMARRFLDDPLCGWWPTVSMAQDIIGLAESGIHGVATSALPPALPVHLLGGTQDPATAKAKGVEEVAHRLRLAGSRDVALEIVEGARHETLNEIEPYRGEAIASLIAWLDRVLPVH